MRKQSFYFLFRSRLGSLEALSVTRSDLAAEIHTAATVCSLVCTDSLWEHTIALHHRRPLGSRVSQKGSQK